MVLYFFAALVVCYFSLAEFLIPIGFWSNSKYIFQNCWKTIWEPWRISKIIPKPSDMFCLFLFECRWEHFKILLESIQVWFFRCTGTVFIYYFSICFHLNRVENINRDSSSEAHFKNAKTDRSSCLDLEVLIFVKNSNSTCGPVPLKHIQRLNYNIYRTFRWKKKYLKWYWSS